MFAELFTICKSFPRGNVYSTPFLKGQIPNCCLADIHKLAEFFTNASTFFPDTLVSGDSHSNRPPMKSVGLNQSLTIWSTMFYLTTTIMKSNVTLFIAFSDLPLVFDFPAGDHLSAKLLLWFQNLLRVRRYHQNSNQSNVKKIKWARNGSLDKEHSYC